MDYIVNSIFEGRKELYSIKLKNSMNKIATFNNEYNSVKNYLRELDSKDKSDESVIIEKEALSKYLKWLATSEPHNFDELWVHVPYVRIIDLFALYLRSGDDKIYFNLAAPKGSYVCDYLLKDERMISGSWEPYLMRTIDRLEEECSGEPGLAGVTIVIKEDK